MTEVFRSTNPLRSTVPLRHLKKLEDSYIVGRAIGHSGSGTVFAGLSRCDERKVAIKVTTADKIDKWVPGGDKVLTPRTSS